MGLYRFQIDSWREIMWDLEPQDVTDEMGNSTGIREYQPLCVELLLHYIFEFNFKDYDYVKLKENFKTNKNLSKTSHFSSVKSDDSRDSRFIESTSNTKNITTPIIEGDEEEEEGEVMDACQDQETSTQEDDFKFQKITDPNKFVYEIENSRFYQVFSNFIGHHFSTHYGHVWVFWGQFL